MRDHDAVADDAVPMVGIVVVNYFRGDLTGRCLEALEQLTWPGDRIAVALVDNGSGPGDLDDIRARFPKVRVVEAGANLGFGGACNRGFEVLSDCEHIALVNNDAVPDPDWLEPLVEALHGDPRVGAAVPKILLAGQFVSLELRSPTVRPGGGDARILGIQLCGAKVGGEEVSDRIQLVSGFWGWEHDAVTVGGAFAWTDGAGVCRLPVPTGADRPPVWIRLACGHGPVNADVVASRHRVAVEVGVHPGWTDVGPVDEVADLINSAGTVLLSDGSTADRGYMLPDGPDYASPSDVFGWSGAGVLLRRTYLEDVGGFDDAYFLYYEDADVSWRGRLRGWTYRYEPRAVVRHDHSATIGERSPMAQHLLQRNRLVTLVKHAPGPVVRTALARAVRDFLATVARDVLGRILRFRRPVVRHALGDARMLASAARLLPRAIRQRRSTSEAARVQVWADGQAPTPLT